MFCRSIPQLVASSLVCLPAVDAGGAGPKAESWAFGTDAEGLRILEGAGVFGVRACKLCNDGIVVQVLALDCLHLCGPGPRGTIHTWTHTNSAALCVLENAGVCVAGDSYVCAISAHRPASGCKPYQVARAVNSARVCHCCGRCWERRPYIHLMAWHGMMR